MSGTTTILVTDLVSSTESPTGDADGGVAASTAHLRRVRAAVERHHGQVAKTFDAGVMALFDSSYEATRAAIAIQQEMERDARRESGRGGVRVGCNVGEVIGEGARTEDGLSWLRAWSNPNA